MLIIVHLYLIFQYLSKGFVDNFLLVVTIEQEINNYLTRYFYVSTYSSHSIDSSWTKQNSAGSHLPQAAERVESGLAEVRVVPVVEEMISLLPSSQLLRLQPLTPPGSEDRTALPLRVSISYHPMQRYYYREQLKEFNFQGY